MPSPNRCFVLRQQKPGSATLPFFGVVPAVVDEKGNELEGACEGYLCIKQVHSLPVPSCFTYRHSLRGRPMHHVSDFLAAIEPGCNGGDLLYPHQVPVRTI